MNGDVSFLNNRATEYDGGAIFALVYLCLWIALLWEVHSASSALILTLFLLSYAKILHTIITSLSALTLEYPNDRSRLVWRFDGHVDYLKENMFILDLSLITFPPQFSSLYTISLSQWLQVLSNWKILSWMNSTRVKSSLTLTMHCTISNIATDLGFCY